MKKLLQKLLPFCALLALSVNIYAQAPVITSFSPASGNVGSSVTITGAGYDADAANNVVFFGATQATVTAASATSLTVTVPIGASSKNITVTNTVTKTTGYANNPFVVTYTGGEINYLPASNIEHYSAGKALIGDLNGDGKPDLVVNSIYDRYVSVYLNAATSGTLTSADFSSKTDLIVGYSPVSNALGDLDGDGKLDLVVASMDDEYLSILPNTSLGSDLSFASKINVDAQYGQSDVAIGDFDGDGKPDIALSFSYSSEVWLYRNTTVSGGAITFDNPIILNTPSEVSSVIINDLDGDGKAEVITMTNNQLGVFRNIYITGALGADSFELIDLNIALGYGSRLLAIKDFNNDGKPDIAVSEATDALILSNGSSPGTLTSGDFTTTTHPYGFSMNQYVGSDAADMDGDGKVDLVITGTGSTSNEKFGFVMRNTTASGVVSFAAPISYQTSTYLSGVVVGDLDGDSKPDIVTTDGNVIVSLLRNGLAAPATPASNVNFTNATFTSLTVNWTNGSGANRAVFMLAGDTGVPEPVFNATYNANSQFGSGSQIGTSGWYCVYNGTGNSVTVTNLNPSSAYRVMVVEYSNLTSGLYYQTAATVGNPATGSTVTILDRLSLTSATPAAAAYSLRALSNNYTGPLVRIAVGSSFYDIYPDASVDKTFSATSPVSTAYSTYNAAQTGATLNVLSSIIGSNSATVAIWYDQSGLANDMLQASPGLRPQIINAGVINTLGLRPAVKFGTANLATIQKVIFPTAASMVGVAKGTGATAALITKTGTRFSSLNFPAPFDFGNTQGSFVVGSASTRTAVGVPIATSTPRSDVSSFVPASVYSFVVPASGTCYGYVNGVQSSSETVPAYEDGGNSLRMGNRNDNLGMGNFSTTEVVLFNSVLSTTDRQTVEASQRNYYLPSITSFSPATGSIGSLVTINGSNLGNTTALSIGGQPAIVVSNTSSKLVAMVMPGAVTGNISLTNAISTTASTSNFTVTATPVPAAQQGNKITDPIATGQVGQGTAIALSADGNTAIVGGSPYDGYHGAAWVYVRDGSSWTSQSGLLQGNDAQGRPQQGAGVALSADGNTAIVGGLYDNNIKGAAWIYTRTNGVWSQQGPKLTGGNSVGLGYQGLGVALSADGNTAAVGGLRDDNYKGAVWIYTRTNGVWTQQGDKLTATGTATGSDFGVSVALSADGNTLLAGSNSQNSGQGGAYIFNRVGTTWTQNIKLLPTDGTNPTFFGTSVDLSADGKKAVIGATDDNNGRGAAWVFALIDGSWVQQSNKLTGSDAAGPQSRQGQCVTMSADGTVIMVGGSNNDSEKGATWIYTFDGTNWTQYGSKIIGAGAVGNSNQGGAVAISSDGSTAFIGGSNDNGTKGAVWVFGPAGKNASLNGLLVSAGSLDPVFSADIETYNLNVPADSATLSVTAILAQSGSTARVKVNAGSYTSIYNNTVSTPLPLKVGDNIVVIEVTAQDGTTTKTYTITVTRAPLIVLQNLTLGSAAPITQASNIYQYNAVLEGLTDTRIRLTATLTASGASITINGAAVLAGESSAFIAVSGTDTTTIPIVVTSIYGDTLTHTLRITRVPSTNADLGKLLSSESEVIKTGELEYQSTVYGFNITRLILSPTAADIAASVTVDGISIGSGKKTGYINLNNTGTTEVHIEVTAQDSITKKQYRLVISKAASSNADLSKLISSDGEVIKTGDTTYTLAVSGFSTSRLILSPAAAQPGASIMVNNDQNVGAGRKTGYIALNATGTTIIPIEVTAEDSVTKKRYTVTVSKIASNNTDLAKLLSSEGDVIKTGSNSYTTRVVGLSNNNLVLLPTTADAGASILINNSIAVASGKKTGYISLNTVGSTTIPIEITAEDGVTKKTYSLTVNKAASPNAELGKLISSEGEVTKIGATDYTCTIYGLTINKLILSPTAAESGATLTVDGTVIGSGRKTGYLSLNTTGPTTIAIEVTAEDGITKKQYTLIVNKQPSSNAELSKLLSSEGAVTKINDTNFETTVIGLTTSKLTLLPTTVDAGATILIEGAPVGSGKKTGNLNLNATGSTEILVEVTAEDGTTKKTYTLSVTKTPSTNTDLSRLLSSVGTITKNGAANYDGLVSGLTVNRLTLSPTTAETGATVKINGTTVGSGRKTGYLALTSTGSTDIQIEVTAEDGITKKLYILTVNKTPSANADLAKLLTSEGIITKTGALDYEISVTSLTANRFILLPTAADAGAIMTVNNTIVGSGKKTGYINIDGNPVIIKVTAESGAEKTYTVTVTRPSAMRTSLAATNTYNQAPIISSEVKTSAESAGIKPHQALSPNGDGNGDYFEIEGITSYPENTVTIVNRNGTKVYETKAYDNRSRVFDGHSSINGTLQPAGTYYFVIDYKDKGQNVRKTGFLVIRY
jgi:gliding motility-associated-like protein